MGTLPEGTPPHQASPASARPIVHVVFWDDGAGVAAEVTYEPHGRGVNSHAWRLNRPGEGARYFGSLPRALDAATAMPDEPAAQ